jgi:predicted GNAT family acetyltransferase
LKKFEISTDSARIDRDMVYDFISTSYWGKGRSRALVETALNNSLCFSGFIDDKQVAFGRVLTDKAVFGYVADVFVLPEYRGKGYAAELLKAMLHHPDIKNLQLTMLATRDAHGLYEKLGFRRCPGSDTAMEIFAMQGD